MAHQETITIIVNGRPRDIEAQEITFDQVVHLAFENPPFGADTIFSVTYRKGGNEHRPEGVMVEGDTVKVKKGTTFNVSATNRS
jgi:hypothetical protein